MTALATLSLATGTFVVAGTAMADNPSTVGLFELDTSTTVPPCPVTTPPTTICGNANTADSSAANSGDDWANVYKSFSGLGTATADHAFARTFITDPVSSLENSYYTGGGSKDVNDVTAWQYATANDPVPDKDDIANLFAAAYTRSGDGHTIIYFGMDRYDNNGDAETGFWFFKNPTTKTAAGGFTPAHSVGDVLVLADWGGSNPVGAITVYSWVGGKNPLLLVANNNEGDCATAGAAANFCAVVNRTADSPPWPFLDKSASTSIRPLELFEAGLDLNALFGSDRCFASFLGATRSSHSTTAQLKDFALGNFEQCGASIATHVSSTAIYVGQTVTDNATVTVNGGSTPPAPTGTVTFKVNGATPAFDTKPLSGAAINVNDYTVTSATYTGTTPGHFCFSASWPGDTNYTAGPYIDDQTNECFDVTKRPSSTDTLSNPTGGDVVPGTSVTDTATVSGSNGGPTPTGTVDFFLCQPTEVTAGGCEGTAGTKIGVTKTLVAGVATSDPSTNTTAVGTYCWRAAYSGDDFYTGSGHTDITNECFTTIKLPSSTDTLSSPTGGSVVPGTSVTDTATVTGTGGTPTGTVDFYLCQPSEVAAGGCVTGGTEISHAVLLVAGVATSSASTNTTAIGKYCWRAEYSGSALYDPSTQTDSTNECFTTVKQPSSTDTLSSPNGDTTVGASVSDTATVTGSGATPSGTVDFFLCQPSEVTAGGCEGTAGTKVGATKTLNAGVATSDTSTNTTAVGTYCWRAEYSGDDFYLASAHTDSTHECFTVKDTTSARSAQNWLPNDSATITSLGSTALNGTLSFTLYTGTTCAANGGTILRTAETFSINEASPATRVTSNTATKVLTTQRVSWLVEFTSNEPLVAGSSHCESTSLTILN